MAESVCTQIKFLCTIICKYEYYRLMVKYTDRFVYFTSNMHISHFPGCTFLLALQTMNVEGSYLAELPLIVGSRCCSNSTQVVEYRGYWARPGYLPTPNSPIQSLFCSHPVCFFALWHCVVCCGVCLMCCVCTFVAHLVPYLQHGR